MRVARESTAATAPHDQADESEEGAEAQDDHGRHRCEAVSDRLVMSRLRDLLRHSGDVSQLIHFGIPTMCVRLIRTVLSVG
jgi:hypothetical protein